MLTVPSLAVFAPRSDIVYAFSATMILCLLVQSVVAESKFVRCLCSLLAGGAVFVSLTVSLAHIPVLVACGLFFLLICIGPQSLRVPWQPVVLSGGVTLVVFISALTIWSVATDCNLVRVWSWNLSNHAGFYKQSSRTWWKWFFVNPVELSFSIGLPLTFVFLESLTRIVRGLKTDPGQTTVMFRLALSLIATWAALWLSGKNMGEAARLWCVLTPWFVMVAAVCLAPDFSAKRNEQNHLHRNPGPVYHSFWSILLIAQMIVCTVTVGGVSGYQELTGFAG
jgi:methylthioxylose transferase